MDEPQTGANYKFKDRHGNTWDAMLTMAGALRIDNSDFSLLKTGEFSIIRPKEVFFTELLEDDSLLCAVIFAVVQPQIKANLDIDPEKEPEKAQFAFADTWVAKTIEEARNVFWQALIDFFPKRKIILEMLHRQMERARAKIAREAENLEGDVSRMVDRTVTQGVQKAKKELSENPGEKSGA